LEVVPSNSTFGCVVGGGGVGEEAFWACGNVTGADFGAGVLAAVGVGAGDLAAVGGCGADVLAAVGGDAREFAAVDMAWPTVPFGMRGIALPIGLGTFE
jgi:hypothetical protein